jgi:hypothetical protein
MPSVSAYQKAFGLIRGLVLKDKSTLFTLKESDIQHVVKKIYHEYHFPICLKFIGPSKEGSENHLLNLLNNKINSKDGIIVYSEYGSPYECGFGEAKVDDIYDEDDYTIYKVDSTGWAVRRRDIPTLKEQNEQRRKSVGKTRSKSRGKSADKIDKKDLTIKSSHFNTGKCVTCEGKIEIGEKIAKSKDKIDIRGGWSHLDCM